jgi:hypothetical protein
MLVFGSSLYISHMKKAKKVPNHRGLVVSAILMGAFVMALTVATVQKPVHYTPQAYVQDQAKSIGSSPNTPPSLAGSPFATVRCKLDQECHHLFDGSDPDLNDTLVLTVDFLPSNLTIGSCQTSQTLVGNKKISCELSGIPTRQGTYKLLASINDGTNPPVTKTLTLNVD